MSIKSCATCLTAVLLVAVSLAAVPQVRAEREGTSKAVEFIKSLQAADGGFAEPGEASDVRTTCWAMLAGVSVGENVLSWKSTGATPEQYLNGVAGGLTDLEDFELMTLATAEAGGDPKNLAGRDLVSVIKAHAAENGKIGADIKQHCWGVIALSAAGEDIEPASTDWLVEQQRTDGGWGESDAEVTEDTALASEALIATGEANRSNITAAMKLLRQRMNSDGGFTGVARASDAQATSTVVRAIQASQEDPASSSWTFHGNNPLTFLSSLQSDNGHFQFSRGVESQPGMTTAMTVPALAGKFFPLGGSSLLVENGQGLHDLGTTGAGISAGTSPQNETGGTSSGEQSAGAGGTASGALGFWIFVLVCVTYVGLLLAVVVIVRLLAKPGARRGRADADGRVTFTPP